MDLFEINYYFISVRVFFIYTWCFAYPCTSTIAELSQIVLSDDVMKYENPGILVVHFLFRKIERKI